MGMSGRCFNFLVLLPNIKMSGHTKCALKYNHPCRLKPKGMVDLFMGGLARTGRPITRQADL